jgi:alpha-amylase/alpha-mannosidase (GH57 family)
MKIAFLWHQHQPDYFDGESFIMPWVRFHAVKDYYDIPTLTDKFPNVKQTFNIVPSMIDQLEMYVEGYKDDVMILTEKHHQELSDGDKAEILNTFFMCNKKNLIFKYPRYKELYKKANSDSPIEKFEGRDWLDLQVWYNLTWLGEFSKQDALDLFEKGSYFSEEDKQRVLTIHLDICRKIVSKYKESEQAGNIELSCSPLYHPILPLLIDTNVAHESQDYLNLPNPPFQFRQDASVQVKGGIKTHKARFGKTPIGMWCSEGAVSDETLKLISEAGIQWTATDEEVLLYSGDNLKPADKYFPHYYNTPYGEIAVFFRDTALSDKIGFKYQDMSFQDAVADFMHSLNHIEQEIIKYEGKEALDDAVVSVILDGENCWEYYDNNGKDFMELLFKTLAESQYEAVTFSEAVKTTTPRKFLNRVRAGSWINGNFDIWIGSPQAKKAWELLTEARITLQLYKDNITQEAFQKAYSHILKAEGSDWFWWYCPYHKADNESDFDVLFRKNLEEMYLAIGVGIPDEIFLPIGNNDETAGSDTNHKSQDKDFDFNNLDTWAAYSPTNENTSMHKSGNFMTKFFYAFKDNRLFMYLETAFPDLQKFEIIAEPDAGDFRHSIQFSNEGITRIESSGLRLASMNESFPLCIEMFLFKQPDKIKITCFNAGEIAQEFEFKTNF